MDSHAEQLVKDFERDLFFAWTGLVSQGFDDIASERGAWFSLCTLFCKYFDR